MGVYSFQANKHHFLRAVFPFAFGMANNIVLLIFPHDLVSWKGSESAVDGKGTDRAFEQNITVIEWWKQISLYDRQTAPEWMEGRLKYIWIVHHPNHSENWIFILRDLRFYMFFAVRQKEEESMRNRCHGRPPSSPLWCQSPNRSNF